MSDAPTIAPAETTVLVHKSAGRRLAVSLKMRRVVARLLDGRAKTQVAAAKAEGLSPDYVQRALKKAHVRAYIDEQVQASLSQAKLRSAGRLVELVDGKSEHVAFDATKLALGIAGIKPPEGPGVAVNINNNIVAGYCIDLTEPRSPADVVDVTPTSAPPRSLSLKDEHAPEQSWEDQRRKMDPSIGANIVPV